MANAVYDLGRQSFVSAQINFPSDNIKVALVKIGGGHYVVNLATDQFLGVAIAAGDIIARTANLTGKSDTAGVLNAANTVFAAVAAGPAAGALVLFQDTGVDNTSRLIAYWDTAAGLPATPTGADINLAWSTDANKILKL